MIADIIIIAIMLLCIFLGYMRGLAKVAIKIIGFVASLVIALVLYTPISNYIINNTDIVNNLQTSIQGKIYSGNQEEEKENKEENVAEFLQNYIDDYTEGIKASGAEYIASSIAITTVRVGTWIGLFIVARAFMIILRLFSNIIEKIPVIKQFNKVRRNNIWNIRRSSINICNTCSNKFDCSYDEGK